MGKYLLIALVILPLVPGCIKAKKKKLFLPSNDTIEQIGDGRFEIRQMDSRQTLYDNKLGRSVFQDVHAYLEEDDWFYAVIIKKQYGLLNTETGEWSIFPCLNEVPEEHKATFLKLSSK